MTATLPLFRVHFEAGEPLEVSAATPDQARAEARKRRDGIITKVKKVKDNG